MNLPPVRHVHTRFRRCAGAWRTWRAGSRAKPPWRPGPGGGLGKGGLAGAWLVGDGLGVGLDLGVGDGLGFACCEELGVFCSFCGVFLVLKDVSVTVNVQQRKRNKATTTTRITTTTTTTKKKH